MQRTNTAMNFRVTTTLAVLALMVSGCSAPEIEIYPPEEGNSIAAMESEDVGDNNESSISPNIQSLPSTKPSALEPPPNASDEYSEAPRSQVKVKPTSPQVSSSAVAYDDKVSKSVCTPVGEEVVVTTKIASESTGQAWVEKFLSFQLLEDNRESAEVPSDPDERVILIKCSGVVLLSSGFKGNLNIYFLLDSDGNQRVRWDGFEQIK